MGLNRKICPPCFLICRNLTNFTCTIRILFLMHWHKVLILFSTKNLHGIFREKFSKFSSNMKYLNQCRRVIWIFEARKIFLYGWGNLDMPIYVAKISFFVKMLSIYHFPSSDRDQMKDMKILHSMVHLDFWYSSLFYENTIL